MNQSPISMKPGHIMPPNGAFFIITKIAAISKRPDSRFLALKTLKAAVVIKKHKNPAIVAVRGISILLKRI
jgi:hypothetical protein